MSLKSKRRSSYQLPDSTERNLLDSLSERRQSLGVFRARANQRRSLVQRIADRLILIVGSSQFFTFHLVFFAVWLSINVGLLASVHPYDPYPFGLLTMVLTLEQSLLTICVIMSQNRASDISDLRNEIDLQVNIIAEEEISKTIHMLRLIGEHLNIKGIINDPEISMMEKALDHSQIETQTRQELDGTANNHEILESPAAKLDQ